MGIFDRLFRKQPADNNTQRTAVAPAALNLSGLSIIKQGDCGYFIDNDHVVRAFWVSSLDIAGSKGHLYMTLHLHEVSGELSDIPLSVYYALDQDIFLYAENKKYSDIGGFIIMFDKHTTDVRTRTKRAVR